MFPNTPTDPRNGPSGPPVTEPARYEFQSYLSDYNDEAALLRTAQEPLPAEHPHPDALVSDHAQSLEMDMDEQVDIAQEQEQEQDGPIGPTSSSEAADSAASQADAMDVDSSAVDLTSPPRQETPPHVASTAASSPAVIITRTRRARPVKIVVAVPKISKKKQKTYEVIDLESDDELSIASAPKNYSPRRLRRRAQAPAYEEHRLSNNENIAEAGLKKRKRGDDDTDFLGAELDEDDVEEFSAGEDELSGRPRNTRNPGSHSLRGSRAGSRLPSAEKESRSTRKLRPRVAFDDEKDELQSDDGGGSDFFIVQSDIIRVDRRKKKFRKLSTRAKMTGRAVQGDIGSDIEFENRRSGRATKNTKSMTVSYDDDDDDIFYAEDDKPAATPRTLSVREVFSNDAPQDFKDAHRLVCDTCGLADSQHKGAYVFCQGCSVVQHRSCLGTRSSRDQCVTKVAADGFVMQCRFCVCVHQKKDPRAPSQDTCQVCHEKGPSCAPFSNKKTPKQEELLRVENGGVDPIAEVAPELINNPDNVLFRCTTCHRAWHYEHLPHFAKGRDPALDDPRNLKKHRRDEYQANWLCGECDAHGDERIDKIVAWRPTTPSAYTKGDSVESFNEDDVEYLVKWAGKSYNHCVWLPGAWLHGIVKAAMYKAFVKRTYGESADAEDLKDEHSKDSLMRWSEREAIHPTWITPDIILEVEYAMRPKEAEQKYKRLSREDKFKEDLDRVLHVLKIYVKFEGLGYDDVVWDTPPDSGAGPLWDAFLDAYREFLNGKHFVSQPWSVMGPRLEKFREMDFAADPTSGKEYIEYKEQPAGLQRGKLMTYQVEGLNWMLYNLRNNINCILADEMGLGKTVQVVALLTALVQDNPKIWPFLVIVPNSTCANWRREIKKWAPGLRVVAYYGGKAPQSLALQYELFPKGTREMKAHVVIMSYDSIKDTETRHKFSSVKWAGMVIDEAQALKNDENALYKALSVYTVPFKLLLTGTPLQNNKRELFNLLQFVDKNMFDAASLDEKFAEITKENLGDLHKLIQPYFLRRTKASVLTFLPTMAQIIVPVSMSVIQEKLCKSIMARNPDLIRSIFAQGKLKNTERGSLNNILMQLRKCLCHPFVYSQAVEEKNDDKQVEHRNLVEASSKLVLLQIMLPKLKERGHRVLMFSQFLEQLTMLEDFLVGMDLKYERLDGSQSSLEKQRRIDAFNAPDSKLFCMLLSTRAGGVGINLATADTVIILDPDWNPHQDIQALSRAHRIGQKKKVLCFQLVTVDSPEEKMMQIGRKKMALDHLLIESMDDKEGESLNDVESVLKHGAAALFGEGVKKQTITYDAAAVDKLLDRSGEEETKVDGEKSAESAFAHARVWEQDSGGLKDDLGESGETALQPSVWAAILREREEEAQREADKNKVTLGRGGRRRGPTVYTQRKFDFEEGQDDEGQDAKDRSTDDEDEFMDVDKEVESDGESSGEEGKSRKGSNEPQEASSAASPSPTEAQGPPRGALGPERSNGTSQPRPLKRPPHDPTAPTARPRPRPSSSTPHDRTSDPKPAGGALSGRPGHKRQPPLDPAASGDANRLRKPNGAHAPSKAPLGPVPTAPCPTAPSPTVSGSTAAGSIAIPATAPTFAKLLTTRPAAALPVPQKSRNSQPYALGIPAPVPQPGRTIAYASSAVLGPNGRAPGSVPQPGGFNVRAAPPIPPSDAAPRRSARHAEPALVPLPRQQPSGALPPGGSVGFAVGRQPLTGQLVKKEVCLVCQYLHPVEWDCPEMAMELALRLAMDRLRNTPGLSLERRMKSLQFLHLKLVALHRRQESQLEG